MALRRAATAATASSRKVLLLGWSGCQPRHLAKYEQMYAQLGYTALPFTDHCAVPRMYPDNHAAKLLEIAGAERPAMVHVFSNGGAFLWARALAMAAARGSQELTGIKGQVIDSTPGSFTDLKGGYHFMCEMVGRPVTWAVYPFATAIGAAWYALSLQWLGGSWSLEHNWKTNWVKDARGFGISKSLLLFSTDDLLISAPSVRAFGDMLDAAADEAGEPPSQRTEWKRSAHVQHYRHHPEDYRATVDDFWSDVLRNG